MKKLLCMMLGLAVGAFAYAGDGGDYGFTANEGAAAETLKYAPLDGGDDETAITAYDTDEAKGSEIYETGNIGKPYTEIGKIEDMSYLKVKSSLTAGGGYAVSGSIDFSKNVCVDTLVRFTAGVDAEEGEYPTLNGGKIAVWLKQVDADDTATPAITGETNLYVTAGFYNGAAYVEKAFKVANVAVAPGTWHRVTVRTIDTVLSSGSLTGFLVYVDGIMVACDSTYDIGLTEGLDTKVLKYIKGKNLFISAAGEAATSLEMITFAGNGDIDDTSITWGDAVPAYAVAAVETTITADEGLESFQYKLDPNAVEWTTGIPPLKLELEADALITFNPDGFVCTNSTTKGYAVKAEDDWTASGWSINGTSWKFSGNDNSYINIGVQATDFAVTLSGVGGFATADAALAYLESPEGKLYTGTVTFLATADGTGYHFPANTTIEIANGGVWTITNGNTRDGITWTLGFEAEKQVTINGKVTLGGLIKGDGRVKTSVTVTGACTIDASGLTVGDASEGAGAAFVVGETGTLDTTAGKITLGLNGEVTVNDEIEDLTTVFANEEGETKVALLPNTEYTYALVANTFTVTFKLENEEPDVVRSDVVYGTETATIAPTPTRTGYTFTGWAPALAATVTADATYTAQWEQSIDYVAEVTIEGVTTQYASLVEAFAAVDAGETATITLLKSCSGAGIFLAENQNKTITLDLATYTYTCVGPAVGSTGTQNQAFHLEKGNTVAINNGTIEIAADKGDLFRMVIQNYCDLTLTGVVVDGSNLAINGRTDTYSASFSNGDVVLGAGTVIKPSTAAGKTNWAMDSFVKTEKGYLANVTVNGATIEGNVELGGGTLNLVTGGITGDLVASSKTDADQVTKAPAFVLGGSIPADYKWDENGKLVKKVYVAEVGDNKYETLAEAITAAPAAGTVTLLADVTLTATTTITKELALDLAQKTITFADGIGDGIVFNGADGVISNGTITSTVSTWNVASFIDFIQANGLLKDLSLNSANFQWGVGGDLGDDETWKTATLTYEVECENVDIVGPASLFYAEGVALTLDADCSAVQSGTHAQYWRNCAIHAGALANVTVNGGDYTGTYPVCLMSSPATIAINDGKFTGEFKVVKVSDGYKQYGEHSITISGGDFSDTNIPVEYIEQQAGYTAYWADSETNPGYKTPAWEEIKVAKINDVYYSDLQAAFTAAEEDDVVELVANINVGDFQGTKYTVAAGKKFTLDLAGFELKGNDSVASPDGMLIDIAAGADLTVKDSSESSTGKIICTGVGNSGYTAGHYVIHDNGTLTLESGLIKSDCPYIAYAVDVAGGTFNFNGGSIQQANENARCLRVFSNGTINMKDGTIVSGGIYGQQPGKDASQAWTINIEGGVINGVVKLESNGDAAAVNITGGTFNDQVLVYHQAAEHHIPATKPFVFISNGTFKTAFADDYDATEIVPFEIKGGLFSFDYAEKYLAAGYEKIAGTESGTWTAKATVYDIKYFDGDTELTDLADTYTVEDEVTLPALPVKANYTAVGWFDNDALEGDPVTKIEKGTIDEQKFYASYTADQYTITYKNADGTDFTDWKDDYTAPTTFTVENDATLPVADNIDLKKLGVGFNNWTNAAGTAIGPTTAGQTANLVLFANVTAIVDPVIKEIDEKVDTTGLTPEQKNDVDKNIRLLNGKFDDLDVAKAWITKVYGDGKIQGDKLAKTTEDLIDLSVKYDLQILGEEPEIEIAAAANGTFTFQITDDGEPVELKVAKLINMVEFTADLGKTAFAPQTDATNVNVALKAGDSKTATAEFTKATTAGFMRINLTK